MPIDVINKYPDKNLELYHHAFELCKIRIIALLHNNYRKGRKGV